MGIKYAEGCYERPGLGAHNRPERKTPEEQSAIRTNIMMERLRKKYRRFAPIVTACGRLHSFNHLVKPCPACIRKGVSYTWEKTQNVIVNRLYVMPAENPFLAGCLKLLVANGYPFIQTMYEYPTPKVFYHATTRVMQFYDPVSNVMFDCFKSLMDFETVYKNYHRHAEKLCTEAGYGYCAIMVRHKEITVLIAPDSKQTQFDRVLGQITGLQHLLKGMFNHLYDR